MKKTDLWLACLWIFVLAGCDNAPEPFDTGSGDSDSDTDTDSDSDSDSDTDSDTDTDDWGSVYGQVAYAEYDYYTWEIIGWNPVADTTVIAEAENGTQYSDVSDEEGEYSIQLPPGTYSVFATCEPYYSEYAEVGVNEDVLVNIRLGTNVDAPYIYLYPTETTEVSVTLDFGEHADLTVSDPPYGDGWTVVAEPSGLIDGEHDFLFYEIAVPWGFDTEAGFAVEGEEVFDWFEQFLPELGLNQAETDDFIEFWEIYLPEADCYAIYPQSAEAIDAYVKLTIDPEPDSLLRLWLAIEASQDCAELPSPFVPEFVREGFTVVEWGVVLSPGFF